jgi:hypothetical protein
MFKLTLEIIAAIGLCAWLFNLLSFVKQPVKDAVNIVLIIIVVILEFV